MFRRKPAPTTPDVRVTLLRLARQLDSRAKQKRSWVMGDTDRAHGMAEGMELAAEWIRQTLKDSR